MKIQELTLQQHNKMLEFREEYRQIGTSCEPADFETAKRVISGFYAIIGKPAPTFFLCQSPIQAQIEMNILKVGRGANLWANIWANIWANLRANLGANLGANLRANLGDNLMANLRANLGDNLMANLRDNLREYFHTNLLGQLDSYWVAYYLFPHLYIKPMHTYEQMELLMEWDSLCHSCGFWYPFENVCFVCDRFSELHQDSENRLHNPDGAAMVFRDGYSIYAVHGTIVPSWIITNPEQITASAINSERNIEIRRVMLERLTPAEYLRQSNAVLLDRDWLNQVELYEITADDGSVLKMTKSTCHTTGQEYVQIVPHQAQTANEALCLRYGVKRYAPVDQS